LERELFAGVLEKLNGIKKVLFWTFTILLGFVNPLISVALIVLYYLPAIIQDLCPTCEEEQEVEMNSFSDDILEEMK